MLLMIPWGFAADRLGRKPVLVFSLAGVSVATALFGLSKTIWQMVGNWGVLPLLFDIQACLLLNDVL